MLGIGRKYKNLSRLRQIINVLIRHGFGHLIERLNLHDFLSPLRRLKGIQRVERLSPSRRLRQVLEELGPTFIKFGQILSSRPDLLPEDLYDELCRLQDQVSPFPFNQVKAVVEKELGNPLEGLFSFFSESPQASASLAQVHQARLKSGEEVVVKVERPGLKETITADIAILQYLANLVERYIPEARIYNPVTIVKEFSYLIQRELDFTIEAGHADRLKKLLADDSTVFIPKIFWDFTTPRLLTLEKVTGIKITDFEALDRAGFDRRTLAFNGVNIFFRQIFDYGFFHADPHPGNIFVLKDGRLALVDFGLVGRLSKPMLKIIARIFVAMVNRDSDEIIQGYTALGILREEIDKIGFQRDIEELLDRYHNVPLKRIQAEEFFNEIVRLAARHRLSLPTDFILLGKTIFIIGGLGRRLYPEFNLLEAAEPFARKLIVKRFEPKELAASIIKTGGELLSLLTTFPRQWRELLAKLNRGEMKIEFEHKGLDNFIIELDRASNRLSFSLIIAAIIIGSSLIIRIDKGPKLFDYPLLGIAGYIVAGLLGLWLAIAILRTGKL